MEDENGVRAGGRKGGDEPRQTRRELFRSEAEEFPQILEGSTAHGLLRMWKRAGGAGCAEVAGQVLSKLPTLGGDLNCFTLGIVQVDEDLAGTGGDAASDGRSRGDGIRVGGEFDFSLQGLDGIAEDGLARDDGMFSLKAGEEPVELSLGLARDDLAAFEKNRNIGEDLADIGCERRGGAGRCEEGFDLPGASLRKFCHHAS